MKVTELSREQLIQLKEAYMDQLVDIGEWDSVSYEELANADEIISDAMIFKHYEGVNFVEEDFASFCLK